MYQPQGPTQGRRTAGRVSRAIVFAVASALIAVSPSVSADPAVQPRNLGGGITRGSLTYAPTAMPAAGALCRTNLAFTLGSGTPSEPGWAAEAFVLNTVISGFEGPVTITGSGSSGGSCESYALGGGTMQLALHGYNPLTESRLDCNSLTGTYTRVLSDMTLILHGNCVVNQFGTGVVIFVARIQVVPTGGGAGVLAPVASANTVGVFTVAPA